MTAEELRRLARDLELEICVGRLVAHVLPPGDTPGRPERPGRLRVLEDIVQSSPGLFQALLDENADAIDRGWTTCLGAHGDDPRFLHAVAALSRERALATDDPSGGPLVFATALWALLLGSDQFWAEFGEPDTGVRSTLLETVFRELCTLHVTLGSRALAAGTPDIARPHIAILADCQEGSAALVRFVGGFGLRYRLTTGGRLPARVSAIARDALGGWCTELIRVATEAADDPDAIAKLPAGIKKDYSSGLAVLAPFVGAGIPVAPVLSLGLDWYSKWCFDLYARKDVVELRERLTSAGEWADRLVPLCDKGSGHLPANKALSEYFMFRGYAAHDTASETKEYEESLAWNPANENARDLLGTATVARVGKRLDAAAEAFEKGRFEAAATDLRAALDLGPELKERKVIRQQLAGVLNGCAVRILDGTNADGETLSAAIVPIIDRVRAQLKRQGWVDTMLDIAGLCAACDGIVGHDHGRDAVVRDIRSAVERQGRYRLGDPVRFWQEHERHLCPSCRSRLRSVVQAPEHAAILLREAELLDPGNSAIKENRRIIDQMGKER